MSFRPGLVGAISLMSLGCATNPSVSTSEPRMWREQKEYQQRLAREAGRIGYIGNEGPRWGPRCLSESLNWMLVRSLKLALAKVEEENKLTA
jgi:hypothetical protein